MDYKVLVTLMFAAILVNNYILRQFLGVCPFLGVSKDMKGAVGMSAAIIFVMLLATAVTWPVQKYLLDRNNLGYLQTIVFILIIATLVQIVEIVLKKYIPSLYKILGIYLPLMTTNCAIFAVSIVNIKNDLTYIEALVNALGSGIGIFLGMVIFSSIREHTENADPPEAFKGLPLTLISAAILSFSFFGFNGVMENLFR